MSIWKAAMWEAFRALIQIIVSMTILGLCFAYIGKYLTPQIGGIDNDFPITYASTNINERTRLSDIKGNEEAKLYAQKAISYLRKSLLYGMEEVDKWRMPHGILLHGEPGTGKTMIAKAIRDESLAPSIFTTAASFQKIYVGAGAARIKSIFAIARANRPFIIFIDELDALGSRNSSMHHGESQATIDQLLTEMDPDKNEGVLVIACTNFIKNIDKALIRDGRFDIKIECTNPTIEGVISIFKNTLSKLSHKNVKHEINDNFIKIIAKLCHQSRYNSATITTIINNALLLLNQNETILQQKHLKESFITYRLGFERKDGPHCLKKFAAIHEAGHFLSSILMFRKLNSGKKYKDPKEMSKDKNTKNIMKDERQYVQGHIAFNATAIPRKDAGGVTSFIVYSPEESIVDFDSYENFFGYLVAMAGGYIATKNETNKSPQLSASSDFAQMRKYSESMVRNGVNSKNLFYSDGYRTETNNNQSFFEDEVNKLIEKAFLEADNILSGESNRIHKIASLLMEKRYVYLDEVLEVCGLLNEFKELIPDLIEDCKAIRT